MSLHKAVLGCSGAHDPRGRAPRRVLFLHLGRSGLGHFTLELARSLAEMPHARATICLPRQHAVFDRLAASGWDVVPADEACEDRSGEEAHVCRVDALRRNVASVLAGHRPSGVVTLIPHVWSPLLAPLIRGQGIRYLTIIHDARPHPRDPARLLNGWALRDAANADAAVTLSQSVAHALAATGAVPRRKLVKLFHPDLTFGPAPPSREETAGPFRVLVLARGPVNDGLAAVTGAIEHLRAQGLPVALGVFGEVPLGPLGSRLEALGSEVENRRMADCEMSAALGRHQAVAILPSCCGGPAVAAVALGAGLPLIGCEGGRLPEQLKDGITGVIADGADPASLAAAIARLATDHALHAGIRAHIRRSAWERSMRRFAEHLVALATDGPQRAVGFIPPALTWV
jgi:glycosyltransferase involved in cell wall biosynthesis